MICDTYRSSRFLKDISVLLYNWHNWHTLTVNRLSANIKSDNLALLKAELYLEENQAVDYYNELVAIVNRLFDGDVDLFETLDVDDVLLKLRELATVDSGYEIVEHDLLASVDSEPFNPNRVSEPEYKAPEFDELPVAQRIVEDVIAQAVVAVDEPEDDVLDDDFVEEVVEDVVIEPEVNAFSAFESAYSTSDLVSVLPRVAYESEAFEEKPLISESDFDTAAEQAKEVKVFENEHQQITVDADELEM